MINYMFERLATEPCYLFLKCKITGPKHFENYVGLLTHTYFIFNVTPIGTPTATAAATELCFETDFSAPISRRAPNVPAL